MNTPSEIAANLWAIAVDQLTIPQAVVIVAADHTHCAYRTNILGGTPALIVYLRTLADKLEEEIFSTPNATKSPMPKPTEINCVCPHTNLHVERFDGSRTVCLDCNNQVWIQPFTYATHANYDGEPMEEIAKRATSFIQQSEAAREKLDAQLAAKLGARDRIG